MEFLCSNEEACEDYLNGEKGNGLPIIGVVGVSIVIGLVQHFNICFNKLVVNKMYLRFIQNDYSMHYCMSCLLN